MNNLLATFWHTINLRRLVEAALSNSSVRKGTLAVLSQGVISAANFLTIVIIGRTATPSDLGVYSLAFGVLGLAMVLESALVFTPYAVYRNRYDEQELRRYAGGSLVLFVFLLCLLTILFVAAGFLSTGGWLAPEHSVLFWTLAAVAPCYLLHALARRISYAHLQFGRGLVIDTVRAVVQVASLLYFASRGNLTAATAFMCLGVACGLTGATWLFAARHRFSWNLTDVRATFSRNFAFGKWLLGSESISRLRLMIPTWILAVCVNTGTAGTYAALASLVTLINPFVMGFNNFFAPKAARTYARGGSDRLSKLVWKGSLTLGGILCLYFFVMCIAGSVAVNFVYSGKFLGHAITIAVMAAARAIGLYGRLIGASLRAIERPDISFRFNLLGVITMIMIALALVHPWQLLGVACASLLGNVVATLGVSISFWRQMVRSRADNQSLKVSLSVD